MAVAVWAAAAVLVLAGCGSGSGKSKDAASATSSAADDKSSAARDSATPSSDPSQILATLTGEQNIEVTIDSAIRDTGGFVTVKGTVTNNGTAPFNAVSWRGTEVALAQSGPSVAGAVLVDEAGKKRYYVLRDTEGKCLCTMGLVGIQPKETRPFFAQFPAPPASTTEVDFELPTMPPAKIQISEG
jgi:hypothetical protein